MGNGITRGHGTIKGLTKLKDIPSKKEIDEEEIKDMDLVMPSDLKKQRKNTKAKKLKTTRGNRYKKEKGYKLLKKNKNNYNRTKRKTQKESYRKTLMSLLMVMLLYQKKRMNLKTINVSIPKDTIKNSTNLMNNFSNRVKKIKPSFTLEMATIAAEMKSKGIDIVNFSVGEPDFNTPLHIIDAGKVAMDKGYTKYTAGPGLLEFRQAICDKLERENNLTYNIENILVSNGEKQSLYTACQALFDVGDEVIVCKPYWVSFPEFVRLADAEPIIVKTLPEKNFEIDFKDLEKNSSKK